MSFDPQPLLLWFRNDPTRGFELGAIPFWFIIAGGLALIVLMVSMLSVLVNHRGAGGRVFFGELSGCLSDLTSLSPRRIGALAKLTFLEAYRRKALSVFVVFALLFMFAGWFMGDTKEITSDQVKVYISFVLRAISWLTLPVVLVLCAFGIPEDIRLRSLHTVVTKPARRLEIVLGRVIGFSLIGTLVLLVMSSVGYIWIVRQIPKTVKDQGLLTCRVPVYGTLSFLDRAGAPAEKGINTGDLWEFRSYIEGATAARAIWTFQNIDESALDADDNLHLENQFAAFRSYKGDMNRQLLYDFKFINPEKQAAPNQPLTFTTEARQVNENRGATAKINRKLGRDGDEKTYDLIKDFVKQDGSLTVEVSCIDREQYLGMARPDLFIRKPDRPFWIGYAKAVLGIELMIILVAIMAVTASTFLKGPIATVLTFSLLMLGGEDSHKFMDELVGGTFKGGGFLESIYRIVTHMNPTTDLPDNPAFGGMRIFDAGLTSFLWLCKQVIPRLQYFNMSEYVANGFDVPWDASVVPSLLVTLGYLVPCVLLGYFALRIRELESK
ncbi:MAG: hypothetical protein AABP62_16370 [Planctomycetota bacterium]